MQSSGWKPGTALGASSVPIPAHESSAAKVRISVKDNTLGLGASLKSKNAEHQRTGLDAFQGLLGRLNARDEGELKKVEEKIENKKLAMFAQGRWGGMMFVPGGLLVQDDPRERKAEREEQQEPEAEADVADDKSDSENGSDGAQQPEKKRKRAAETSEERAQRKAEKKQRKEERRIRREAKRLKKLQKEGGSSTPMSETTHEMSTGASTPVQTSEVNVASVSQERLRNGRHILRGRNILAKRMAFTDSKGLDQIFMRQQQQAA